jgi:hypothetical protein
MVRLACTEKSERMVFVIGCIYVCIVLYVVCRWVCEGVLCACVVFGCRASGMCLDGTGKN